MKFSKKEIKAADWDSAICPTCGERGTTNLSPEEQKAKGWECADCANKRFNELENTEEIEEVPPVRNPPVQNPFVQNSLPEDPGSKEISKYDNEYIFLVRLVKLLGKEAPEALPEIKKLSLEHPFKTITDIEYLTTQIWNLAVTKYQIPREWLIKSLPEKKGSLNKKANSDNCSVCGLVMSQRDVDNGEDTCEDCLKNHKKADLWPAQEEASEGTCTQAPGQIAYNPDQEKDTSVSGPNPQDVANEDALWDTVVKEFFTAHKRWSEVVKTIQQAHPEVTNSVILSLKDRVRKSLDNQMGITSSRNNGHGQVPRSEAKFRVKLFDGRGVQYFPNEELANKYYEIALEEDKDPSKPEPFTYKKQAKHHLNMDQVIKILDSKENKIDHVDFTDNTLELLDHTILTFDEATTKAMEIDKESVFSGAEFSTDDVGVNPSMDGGPFSSPADSGATDQVQPFPNTNWVPADDENKDEQPYSNIASNLNRPFSKKAYHTNILSWAMHDPQIIQHFKDRDLDIKDIKKYLPYLNIKYWDKSSPVPTKTGETTVGQLESENPSYKLGQSIRAYFYPPTGEIFINPALSLEEVRGTLTHEIEHALQDSEGILPHHNEWESTPYDIRTHEWGAELPVIRNLKNKGYSLEQVYQYEVDKTNQDHKDLVPMTIEDMSEGSKNKYEQLYELADEVEPASVVSNLNKKANPSTRYWIAPDGKEFPVSGIHPVWISDNAAILKKYGIEVKGKATYEIHKEMLDTGWSRISNERRKDSNAFQIEVGNLGAIPPYVDDFIAKNYTQGETVLIGDGVNKGVFVQDPFPSIQKAVNKALRNPVNASKKQAAISGQIVRDILEVIESSGGITYNMQQGNLAGTPNYSVSVYPEREKIVDGVADFDDIENYIEANEDLLSQSSNSFGVWSNNGQVYYDVVVTIPDREEALKLARDNNQLAIWDLKNSQEIPTGVVRAFSKNDIVKKAEILEISLPYVEGRSLPVIVNPTYGEAMGALKRTEHGLRYLVDDDDNTFVWPSWNATHDEVAEKLREDGYRISNTDSAGMLDSEVAIQYVIGSLNKKAKESLLPQAQMDEIAAKYSPIMNIALADYADAVRRGHAKDRALSYAVQQVSNLGKVSEKDLIECANTYLV